MLKSHYVNIKDKTMYYSVFYQSPNKQGEWTNRAQHFCNNFGKALDFYNVMKALEESNPNMCRMVTCTFEDKL